MEGGFIGALIGITRRLIGHQSYQQDWSQYGQKYAKKYGEKYAKQYGEKYSKQYNNQDELTKKLKKLSTKRLNQLYNKYKNNNNFKDEAKIIKKIIFDRELKGGSKKIYTGPKGGKYYIKNNKKIYLKKD